MCINFLQITQKIITKDIFHWLELITEILSFLQIFSVRKTTTQLFEYFRNSARISAKRNYFGIFWALKSKLQIIHAASSIVLFLPDSNHCFFICVVPYIPIVSTIFSFCIFIFTFFFILFLPRDTFFNLQCSIRFHYNLPIILRR